MKRLDYRPSPFMQPKVEMAFDLGKECTTISAVLHVERNPAAGVAAGAADLSLDGWKGISLKKLTVAAGSGAAVELMDFTLSNETLVIPASSLPDADSFVRSALTFHRRPPCSPVPC